MKIDNVLMQISKSTMRILTHHASKINRASSKVITYRYTVKFACCAIIMKNTQYKELNEKIVKDHISLSHQDEILKLLINVVIHEKIDLVNAYYQILIYSDDIHKTAFKISFRLYE